MNNNIKADKETLIRLKAAYITAVNDDKETFIFDDAELVTKFARYLIEYIESLHK